MEGSAVRSAAPPVLQSAPADAPGDPLLECLLLLAEHHHRPVSRAGLRAGLPLAGGPLTPALFVRAAGRAGLSARVLRRPLAALPAPLLPAVVLLHDGGGWVLVGLDAAGGVATVRQPEQGGAVLELPLAALEARYRGEVILVRPAPPEGLAEWPAGAPAGHWLWGTLARSWRVYRDVLLASVLINAFALATPLYIMNVYDRVVPNGARETLWVLTAGVCLVLLFDLLLRGLRGYFIDLAGKQADLEVSARLFEKVLGLRLADRPPSVGAFASTLSELESIQGFVASATVATLIDLPFVLLFLYAVQAIGGPLALIPLAGALLLLAMGLVLQWPLRRAVASTVRGVTERQAALIETLTGLETVKALGVEGRVQRRWEQVSAYIAHWGARARLLSAASVHATGAVTQLAVVAVVVAGVYRVGAGELSLGGLIACVILAGRAMAPMTSVAALAASYHRARTALAALDQLMALPVEGAGASGPAGPARPAGGIQFDQVAFAYPGQEDPVLAGVSFTIQPGERVGVIGRTGSGKSTLARLIMGLYAPSAGAVRLDGVDARQLDPHELRLAIGYVPQDPILFSGSLRENLLHGAPGADPAAVARAAAVAGLDELAAGHALGLDLPVGERGEWLSGGQRQAVAAARAVLRDPAILLLDEPSNAMDASSEARLKAGLAGVLEGRTLLVITHRASLLDLVDRLIVLDRGQVVADGPRPRVLEALQRRQIRVATP
jgi:ATP-binding cassette subfamily C protein LapB